MVRDNFAIFILTHGRPDKVLTYKTLQTCNYSGKVYFVVDNEDKMIEKYKENFGEDRVLVFDKLAISKTFDTFDLSEDRRTIVYARNVCFKLAEELGIDYFLELDDDYYEIKSRYEKDGKLTSCWIYDLDSYIEATLEFLDTSNAHSVCWSQMGDFIGGTSSTMMRERVTRKVMNSFFCKVDKKFDFVGRINEDVNTYCWFGSMGYLFLSVCDASINQLDTQSNKGGMTGVYSDGGTYLKSFYTVMCCPSFVKIGTIGVDHIRYHHNVSWDNGIPKIISDRFKKS